jgi:archaemetzincin
MILVRPIGEIDQEILQGMLVGVRKSFGFPASIGPPVPMSDDMFDPARNQYSSAAILRTLVGGSAGQATRVLGVAGVDLFIPMLSFVFGQAQVGGQFAVVSVARLRQEFYDAPPHLQRAITRSVKEAVHELGHTFGLLHCRNVRCPMSLSNTLQHVDAKGEELCDSCSRLLDDYLIHNGLSVRDGHQAENAR